MQLIPRKIKFSWYSRYRAEACNDRRGPTPRLRTWMTQLRRNIGVGRAVGDSASDLTGLNIEPANSIPPALIAMCTISTWFHLHPPEQTYPLIVVRQERANICTLPPLLVRAAQSRPSSGCFSHMKREAGSSPSPSCHCQTNSFSFWIRFKPIQ